MSKSTTFGWFKFCAYNTEAQYGYGSEVDAARYCDLLNANRNINTYSAEFVGETDAGATKATGTLNLGNGNGFNLDEVDFDAK